MMRLNKGERERGVDMHPTILKGRYILFRGVTMFRLEGLIIGGGGGDSLKLGVIS